MATVPSSLVWPWWWGFLLIHHFDGLCHQSSKRFVYISPGPLCSQEKRDLPPLFAYGLTDECFAFNLVAVKGNEDGSPEEDQTINLISMLDRSISSSLGCYLGIFLQLVPGPCFLYPYGHVPWHRVKLCGFTDPCHGRHCLRSHICLFSTFIPFKLHIVLTNLTASISFTVLTRKKEARHEWFLGILPSC